MKSLCIAIVCLFFMLPLQGQNEATEKDFELLNNISLVDIAFSVYVKSEDSKFSLKICKMPEDCVFTQEFVKDISFELLSSSVISSVKEHFTIDATQVTGDEKKELDKLLEKLKEKDLVALIASKDELENSMYSIDNEKDQYSAKVILNKIIPYQIDLATSADSVKLTQGTGTLELIDAKIHFFNNKAYSIYIKAILKNNGVSEKLIFENNSFSVALRYFNKYGSTVSIKNKNRDEITIDYNDAFDYESDQFFNYSVANRQISLSHLRSGKSESKVIQRRFFDFFTAIIYTDVMGFNTENSNSILNTQAKLLLPLNLKNWKKLSLTRQFTSMANIALNNSFEDESRFIAITDDATFSNFDLLRKNNLYGKLNLDVFTYESKGWFLNTSLGYSTAFYRTGFRYTQTQPDDVDVVTNRQLLSIGHGPYLNFEIRPQTNFGADINISLEDLNYNDTKIINGRNFNNDIIVDGGKNHFIAKYNLINVEANFYWLTSPEKSKGGIYSKLGCYYHTESHSVFPQLMVGYATNLTSFVNRFSPKKEIKETE